MKLSYAEKGPSDGETVVLVPGLGMSRSMWPLSLTEALADAGLRVIMPDNRDAGESPRFDAAVGPLAVPAAVVRTLLRLPVSAPYDLGDMADDIAALAARLGIDRFHVVGISLGGMVSQVLACRHPARLLSLSSISSATGNPSTGLGEFRAVAAILRRPRRRLTESEMVRWTGRLLAVLGGKGPYAYTQDEIVAAARRRLDEGWSPEGGARQLLALLRSGDRRRDVSRIAVPTLIMHGTADPLLPFAAGQETADLVSGSRFEAIPGMGHGLSEAGGAAVAPILLKHLSAAAA